MPSQSRVSINTTRGIRSSVRQLQIPRVAANTSGNTDSTVTDVLAVVLLEILLDGLFVLVVSRDDADGNTAAAKGFLVGLGVLLGHAGADQRSDQPTRDSASAAAGQCRRDGSRDDQSQAGERDGGADRGHCCQR